MRISQDLALPSCASESGPFQELVRLPRPCFRGHECSAPLCCSKLRQAEFVARGGLGWPGGGGRRGKKKNPGGRGKGEDGENRDAAPLRVRGGGVGGAARRPAPFPVGRR